MEHFKIIILFFLLAIFLTGCKANIASESGMISSDPITSEDNKEVLSHDSPSAIKVLPSPSIVSSDNKPFLKKVEEDTFGERDIYDEYEFANTLPTVKELSDYLECNIKFHNLRTISNMQLWILYPNEDLKVAGETKLLAYQVSVEDENEWDYYGVDKNTGYIYRWKSTLTEKPEIVATKDVFPTAKSALIYFRYRFVNAMTFTVPFEFELIESDPPFYMSQTLSFNENKTSTYFIEIENENDDSFTIHSYEVVMDTPEEGHTATGYWMKVYKNGFLADIILENKWIVTSDYQPNLAEWTFSNYEEPNLDEWIGNYSFYEYCPPNQNMVYQISIYRQYDLYLAKIEIDGFQTLTRKLTRVVGDENHIDLVFEKYLEDDIDLLYSYNHYRQGDIFLSLSRTDSEIYTTWGKWTPLLLSNYDSGIYLA